MTYEEFQKSLWESKSKTGNISLEKVIDRLSFLVYDMHQEIEALKNENFRLALEIVRLSD